MNRTNRCVAVVCVSVILFVSAIRVSFAQHNVDTGDAQDGRSKSDEILSNIMQDCVNNQVESVTTCLKLKVSFSLFLSFFCLIVEYSTNVVIRLGFWLNIEEVVRKGLRIKVIIGQKSQENLE